MSNKKEVQKFAIYLKEKKIQFGLTNEECGKKCGISAGEISKIINEKRQSIRAKTYYAIIQGFGDSFEIATNKIFGKNSFKLADYKKKKRNDFGTFMLQYEITENSIEEISYKTGLSETRLSELYFGRGSLEAFELILIEKAIGKNIGELFKLFYGNINNLNKD